MPDSPAFSIYGEICLRGKDEVIESLKEIDEEASSTAESLDSSLSDTSSSADTLAESLTAVSDTADRTTESVSDLQSTFTTTRIEKFGDKAVAKMREVGKAIDDTFSSSGSNLSQFFESLGDAFLTLTDYVDEYITPFFEAIADYQSQELENRIQVLEAELDAMKESYEDELGEYEDKVETEKALLKQQYRQGQISYAEYVAACKALNDELSEYEAENAEEQAELEEEIAAEQDKLAKKEFEAEKVNQIAQIWIDAAVATVKCFSSLGPIAGAIATALVATTAAIQTATISSQKYQSAYAKGGIVDKPTVGLIGEAGKEAVVPLENNTEWVGTLKDILMPAVDESLRTAVTEGVGTSASSPASIIPSAEDKAEDTLSALIGSFLSHLSAKADTMDGITFPAGSSVDLLTSLSDTIGSFNNLERNMYDTVPSESPSSHEEEDSITSKLDEILDILTERLNGTTNDNLQVVLDTGVIAGAITGKIDNRLGKSLSMRSRGVAL